MAKAGIYTKHGQGNVCMNLSEYIGLEFQAHGRGPRYDCWGLVRLFYRNEMGVVLPKFAGAYFDVKDAENIAPLVDAEKKAGRWEKVSGPEWGNVLLFNVAGRPIHVGVSIDHRKMLHIEKGKNSVIEEFTSRKWKPRTEGCYRFTG